MKTRSSLITLVIGAAAMAGGCDSVGSQRAKGVVFEDHNGNGRRDEGEAGVAGVLVSNQRDVVETDTKGHYRLKVWDDGTVLFVVKPPGYELPLTGQNLPRFYYIHQPDGSPEFQYAGVSPTGALPESVDFPLIRAERRDEFDVVVFSDPQPRSREEVGYIRDDVVAGLVGVDAAFGITLGDIVYNDLSLLERYNEVVARIGIPFFNVPGNHDMNYDAADDRFSLESFKRVFGPTYYAFEYGNASFIVLDSVEWLGRAGGEDSGHYRGRLGDRQLDWVERYLRHVPDDRLVVLSAHIPLYCARLDIDGANIVDRERLFRLLEGRKVLALAGHMHVFEYDVLDESVGWRGESRFVQVTCASVSGSWWSGPKDARGIPTSVQRDGTPNGYHLFHFDGDRWTQRYRAAGRGEDFQARISSPVGTVSASGPDATDVVVNVFAGWSDWTVEWSLDGEPAGTMKPSVRTDPYFERVRARHPDTFDRWIEAVPSSHIWSAPLPGGLAPGVHLLTVTATDPRKRRYTTSSVFEVE